MTKHSSSREGGSGPSESWTDGRPPRSEDVSYDLARALGCLVSVRASVPEDAFTAPLLGTERAGNGVLIGEGGLVLTVGYLIVEAESVWITDSFGRAHPAHVQAYDQETGFGLLQILGAVSLPALPIGSSSNLKVGDRIIMAGHGGSGSAVKAHIIDRQPFAGYWEYLIEDALFTNPAHPNWGGTALIDPEGRLCGIGSLMIQRAPDDDSEDENDEEELNEPLPDDLDALGETALNAALRELAGDEELSDEFYEEDEAADEDDSVDCNMVIPIDLLRPILDDLVSIGRSQRPPRPWLGMFTTEAEPGLIVAGLVSRGPAARAGIRVGDVVSRVDGRRIHGLTDMMRRIWSLGDAGVEVPLTVEREGQQLNMRIASVTRDSFLKGPAMH